MNVRTPAKRGITCASSGRCRGGSTGPTIIAARVGRPPLSRRGHTGPRRTLHMIRAIAETIHIPAREARALRVEAGGRFRVVDVEGGQVADTWAFVAEDPGEHHSAQH